MKPNLELEADKLNQAETEGAVLGTVRGSHPRPIRKRGYHRALKRGEAWAVQDQQFKEMMYRCSVRLIEAMYNAPVADFATSSSLFKGTQYER
jgi:hypothetical protein